MERNTEKLRKTESPGKLHRGHGNGAVSVSCVRIVRYKGSETHSLFSTLRRTASVNSMYFTPSSNVV